MSTEGWDVVERAAELARSGEEFALATVVWRQGPSSGQMGSRAIITRSGQLYGFIGGACAEPVVLREAVRVIESREPRLLFLGTADVPQSQLPEGMLYVPMSCQSEGALQIYVEPVVPSLDLVVVGSSPMTHTLADLATALGWDPRVVDASDFSADDVGARSVVVIASQGHGDEEAVALAVTAEPLFVGLVASRKRGEALLAYLGERGVSTKLLERVRTPVGLDLGRTSHREIAVSVLAELVMRRAAGEFSAGTGGYGGLGNDGLGGPGARPRLRDDRHARRRTLPGRARRHDVLVLLRRLLDVVRGRPGTLPERSGGVRRC